MPVKHMKNSFLPNAKVHMLYNYSSEGGEGQMAHTPPPA